MKSRADSPRPNDRQEHPSDALLPLRRVNEGLFVGAVRKFGSDLGNSMVKIDAYYQTLNQQARTNFDNLNAPPIQLTSAASNTQEAPSNNRDQDHIMAKRQKVHAVYETMQATPFLDQAEVAAQAQIETGNSKMAGRSSAEYTGAAQTSGTEMPIYAEQASAANSDSQRASSSNDPTREAELLVEIAQIHDNLKQVTSEQSEPNDTMSMPMQDSELMQTPTGYEALNGEFANTKRSHYDKAA